MRVGQYERAREERPRAKGVLYVRRSARLYHYNLKKRHCFYQLSTTLRCFSILNSRTHQNFHSPPTDLSLRLILTVRRAESSRRFADAARLAGTHANNLRVDRSTDAIENLAVQFRQRVRFVRARFLEITNRRRFDDVANHESLHRLVLGHQRARRFAEHALDLYNHAERTHARTTLVSLNDAIKHHPTRACTDKHLQIKDALAPDARTSTSSLARLDASRASTRRPTRRPTRIARAHESPSPIARLAPPTRASHRAPRRVASRHPHALKSPSARHRTSFRHPSRPHASRRRVDASHDTNARATYIYTHVTTSTGRLVTAVRTTFLRHLELESVSRARSG